jgi:hypothetical protein
MTTLYKCISIMYSHCFVLLPPNLDVVNDGNVWMIELYIDPHDHMFVTGSAGKGRRTFEALSEGLSSARRYAAFQPGGHRGLCSTGLCVSDLLCSRPWVTIGGILVQPAPAGAANSIDEASVSTCVHALMRPASEQT